MSEFVSLPQVARQMGDRAPHLAEEIVREVWEIPGYGDERLSRRELASVLEGTVQGVADSLRDMGEADSATQQSAQHIGEVRALQGVPVDAMIQSWMTVQRVVIDHLVAQADHLTHEDLRRGVVWVGRIFAALTRASVDTYRRTQDEVTAHYDRLTGDLVARLAGARPTDAEDITERARVLGVDPSVEHVALTFSLHEESTDSVPQRYVPLQRHILARLAPMTAGRVLIGQIDQVPLLVLPLRAPLAALCEDLSSALEDLDSPSRALVGLSTQAARLPDMSASCRQAKEALDVGRLLGMRDCVVRFDAVLPEILLLRSPDVLEHYAKLLEPLSDRPELLQTLRTYLESGQSAREAARRLFVHVNTIPYRLKTIMALIDQDVATPANQLTLELALRANTVR